MLEFWVGLSPVSTELREDCWLVDRTSGDWRWVITSEHGGCGRKEAAELRKNF
jgi:hypothetical protein